MAPIPVRVPVATYRLQFNKGFTFRDATALVPYLDALGITDVYASPFLAARPGSIHGYDIIDHTRLNPEVGTDEDFDALAAALRARGMGLLMDVVPNHMCIATSENRLWNDVLENGRSSPYARFFDVDWHPPKPELAEKVLLPVLGQQYGRVLEDQQLSIGYDGGAFFSRYWQAQFPIGPRTVRPILEPIVAELRRRGPDDAPELLELESILTAVKHLPTRWDTAEEQIRERQREKEIVKKRIAALVSSSPAVADGLARSLATLNGRKGTPRSFDGLEALLADQAYRLSFWGVAAEEINYRRFFDINDLAAIRVEEPSVLELVHAKPFQLLREGKVTGLRIDHVDGLHDPAQYLADLRAKCACYVVVEKILTGDEKLPPEWPVQGTTGYEFLNVTNGIFVDPDGARALEKIYQRVRGAPEDFDDLLYRTKKLILESALSSELYVLARRLDRISEQHRWSRDFTLNSLHRALGEVVASFPVYRSYVQMGSVEVSPGDRHHIVSAVRGAKRRNQSMSASLFDFIADILLLRDPEGLSDADRYERRELVARLQQLTGPVMAKGMEDTAFYRYFPLASLNEVGGRPARSAVEVQRFHQWNAQRLATWPHALSATATHDTKRGEDVRARLDALSEIPRLWQGAFRRWQRLNRRHRTLVDEAHVPDGNEEYLFYQTLLGAWPLQPMGPEEHARFVDRMSAYMNKVVKEAKQHTSWINVNEPYEHAVDQFVRKVLEGPREASGDGGGAANAFLDDLGRFHHTLVVPGMLTSLSQLLVKIAAPGVPDFYQGTELWDLTLVDPDNRQPVDYQRRRQLMEALDARAAGANVANVTKVDQRQVVRDLLTSPADGAIKLYVTREALRLRRDRRALFEEGSYLPLRAEGPRSRHAIAFARAAPDAAPDGGRPTILAIAGRFFTALSSDGQLPIDPAVWAETTVTLDPTLPRGPYRDVFTGRTVTANASGAIRLEEVFADVPAALLHSPP
jgi:(1->4)-alpha-D-glucan 1-alpha-D-glucosylmutase